MPQSSTPRTATRKAKRAGSEGARRRRKVAAARPQSAMAGDAEAARLMPTYQACDENRCLPPITRPAVVG